MTTTPTTQQVPAATTSPRLDVTACAAGFLTRRLSVALYFFGLFPPFALPSDAVTRRWVLDIRSPYFTALVQQPCGVSCGTRCSISQWWYSCTRRLHAGIVSFFLVASARIHRCWLMHHRAGRLGAHVCCRQAQARTLALKLTTLAPVSSNPSSILRSCPGLIPVVLLQRMYKNRGV